MKTPIPRTLPSRMMQPSTTSLRAPIKQSSSMIVGPACIGSSTPPMPTPPDKCTFFPICAQDPTEAQVSTIVPSPTCAPTLTKDGINTTPRPMKAERRAIAPGTARKPAARHSASPQPANFDGTLSHQPVPPGPPGTPAASASRNDRRTAFFAHWFTCQSVPCFSATRRVPLSSAVRVVSIASRASPFVAGLIASRASHAASMAVSKAACDMVCPSRCVKFASGYSGRCRAAQSVEGIRPDVHFQCGSASRRRKSPQYRQETPRWRWWCKSPARHVPPVATRDHRTTRQPGGYGHNPAKIQG